MEDKKAKKEVTQLADQQKKVVIKLAQEEKKEAKEFLGKRNNKFRTSKSYGLIIKISYLLPKPDNSLGLRVFKFLINNRKFFCFINC